MAALSTLAPTPCGVAYIREVTPVTRRRPCARPRCVAAAEARRSFGFMNVRFQLMLPQEDHGELHRLAGPLPTARHRSELRSRE